MDKNEMIGKLHSQTGVSVAEAEAALEKTDWDLLDALTLLEKEGKIPPLTSSMTTHTESDDRSYTYDRAQNKSRDFFAKLKEIFYASLTHAFVVKRHGDIILNMPVLIMIIIVLCAFKLSCAALLIGLFLECHYSVEKNPEKKG